MSTDRAVFTLEQYRDGVRRAKAIGYAYGRIDERSERDRTLPAVGSYAFQQEAARRGIGDGELDVLYAEMQCAQADTSTAGGARAEP